MSEDDELQSASKFEMEKQNTIRNFDIVYGFWLLDFDPLNICLVLQKKARRKKESKWKLIEGTLCYHSFRSELEGIFAIAKLSSTCKIRPSTPVLPRMVCNECVKIQCAELSLNRAGVYFIESCHQTYSTTS